MNHQINIGFETGVADENSVRELIRTCAERVLTSEQVDFDAEIDVTVVDADAIVNDAHLKVVVILDRHGDTGGLSMFTHIGERFLNDEDHLKLLARRELGAVPRCPQTR